MVCQYVLTPVSKVNVFLQYNIPLTATAKNKDLKYSRFPMF